LQVFAEFTGLNLVVSDAVSGQISVRLLDVPWVQALGVVLESKGLASRREGKVMWVAPRDEWTSREKKHLEAQTALESVSPLQMLSLRLKYARATEVVQRLSGTAGAGTPVARWLSPRGTALAEPRTNQLFILDVPSRLAEVGQMIQKLDVPVRQVLIEAQIVEADDQFGQSLGVRLGLGSAGRMGNKNLNLGASNATTGAGVVTGHQVNLPAGSAGQTLNVPSAFAVSLFNAAADQFINVEISALEADGRGKVVSRPRVITADQTKALIEQGTELPYQMSSGIGVTAITAGYAINTKHVKTQVQVDNGGTVVLGGIYEDAERNDEAKVPGLGDVPGLGWLFKNRNQTRRKSELLIFLTPRVVTDVATAPAL
jgi:type IV pilus assembly protein PilQ